MTRQPVPPPPKVPQPTKKRRRLTDTERFLRSDPRLDTEAFPLMCAAIDLLINLIDPARARAIAAGDEAWRADELATLILEASAVPGGESALFFVRWAIEAHGKKRQAGDKQSKKAKKPRITRKVTPEQAAESVKANAASGKAKTNASLDLGVSKSTIARNLSRG